MWDWRSVREREIERWTKCEWIASLKWLFSKEEYMLKKYRDEAVWSIQTKPSLSFWSLFAPFDNNSLFCCTQERIPIALIFIHILRWEKAILNNLNCQIPREPTKFHCWKNSKTCGGGHEYMLQAKPIQFNYSWFSPRTFYTYAYIWHSHIHVDNSHISHAV